MTAPDPADARRRAEEALRYDHDHANSPEVRRRLRGAIEALLAAGPEAPPSDAVAATGEMGPARGYLAVCARSVDNVRTGWPASDAVREAAEALTVYCHVCEADRREPCHAVTTGDPAPYPHPERAVAAALAAKGGE